MLHFVYSSGTRIDVGVDMKNNFDNLNLMLGVVAIVLVVFFVCVHSYAQEAGTTEPLSPPVEIQFNLQNSPVVGGEAKLKLTVRPLQDMHADISCLLPEWIEFVDDGTVNLRPCDENKIFDGGESVVYPEAVELFVGPLAAGTIKVFSFSVRINNKGIYRLIARVQALAQWGVKEEIFIIEVNN
jgi:hypothetical protein